VFFHHCLDLTIFIRKIAIAAMQQFSQDSVPDRRLMMNTKTHGTQHSTRVGADSLSQREAIIKKAQESVRASHQRMRSRTRSYGVRV
jgi:hypothetical protein